MRGKEPWLSASTVLAICGIGRLPEGLDPAMLEYTKTRGTLVGDVCRMWAEQGRPDAGDFARALDVQLTPWRDGQGRAWSRFSFVPYLTGLEGACRIHEWQPDRGEVLHEDADTRTWGWIDLADANGGRLEIKTSRTVRLTHRLQAACYGASVVQLTKDGPHVVEPSTEDVAMWRTLARVAHAWIAEQR